MLRSRTYNKVKIKFYYSIIYSGSNWFQLVFRCAHTMLQCRCSIFFIYLSIWTLFPSLSHTFSDTHDLVFCLEILFIEFSWSFESQQTFNSSIILHLFISFAFGEHEASKTKRGKKIRSHLSIDLFLCVLARKICNTQNALLIEFSYLGFHFEKRH